MMIFMDKLPDSCCNCPCEYDSMVCQASSGIDFDEPESFDFYKERHPDCPLKELVLCRDCKWLQQDALFHDYWCGGFWSHGHKVWLDHYCGAGERG